MSAAYWNLMLLVQKLIVFVTESLALGSGFQTLPIVVIGSG